MAPLPAIPVTPSRPFASTGLDYAGPFPILFSKGRGAKTTKGYVAIFVCLVVRAMHIEVISNLTTDAFLAAFARFCARRGLCNTIYSDNATTFRGASVELSNLFKQSSEFVEGISSSLATQGVNWVFIPPRAPHFGGLWEAAVRSFKHHLVRVIGDATFSFEEFSTLTTKIEACLNSRPLSPMSSDGEDIAALTPAHFLVGSSLLTHPEPVNPSTAGRPSLSNRWRLITQLQDTFWQRWKKEALQQLQQRNQWLRPQPNIQKGDVVILKDELTPPTRWPLGLVADVHPGPDGLVRTVSVRTPRSTLMRPIVKLVKLPVEAPDTTVETTLQVDDFSSELKI